MPRRFLTMLLVAILLVFTEQSIADRDVESYLENAELEFQLLLTFCPKERVSYWQERHTQALKAYSDKSEELERALKLIEKEPNHEKIKEVFAFTYLNAINEVRFDTNTKLTEDLGRELLRDKIEVRITPLVAKLESDLGSLKNTSTRASLREAYLSFIEVKRLVSGIDQDVPEKYKYVFMLKASAYSPAPDKVVDFVIHDWPGNFKRVEEYRRQLESIQDVIDSVRFATPKDPLPWLPIATQLSLLLVAIAGWIKSYHGDSYLVIGILVGTSMLMSLILVFYSVETFWNIIAQSIIPGTFIFYWIARKNNWLSHIKNVLRRYKKMGHSQ